MASSLGLRPAGRTAPCHRARQQLPGTARVPVSCIAGKRVSARQPLANNKRSSLAGARTPIERTVAARAVAAEEKAAGERS